MLQRVSARAKRFFACAHHITSHRSRGSYAQRTLGVPPRVLRIVRTATGLRSSSRICSTVCRVLRQVARAGGERYTAGGRARAVAGGSEARSLSMESDLEYTDLYVKLADMLDRTNGAASALTTGLRAEARMLPRTAPRGARATFRALMNV